MDDMIQLPETGFLRLVHIVGDRKKGYTPIYPVSKSTWWQGVKDGRFPKPIKISHGITVWRVEDIRTLISKESN